MLDRIFRFCSHVYRRSDEAGGKQLFCCHGIISSSRCAVTPTNNVWIPAVQTAFMCPESRAMFSGKWGRDLVIYFGSQHHLQRIVLNQQWIRGPAPPIIQRHYLLKSVLKMFCACSRVCRSGEQLSCKTELVCGLHMFKLELSLIWGPHTLFYGDIPHTQWYLYCTKCISYSLPLNLTITQNILLF